VAVAARRQWEMVKLVVLVALAVRTLGLGTPLAERHRLLGKGSKAAMVLLTLL